MGICIYTVVDPKPQIPELQIPEPQPPPVDERPPPSRTDVLAIELAAIARGVAKGHARGLTQGILALCDVLEIPIDADRLAVMEHLPAEHLEALLDAIRSDRCWP